MGQARNNDADFWRALLEFGDDEEQQKRNWNAFCYWKFKNCAGMLSSNELQEFWTTFNVGMPDGNSAVIHNDRIKKISEHFADHQIVKTKPVTRESTDEPLMDFAGETFSDTVSFAGRVLVGANFSNAIFRKSADFRNTAFLGVTCFEGARFEGAEAYCPDRDQLHVADFSSSSFHNSTRFNGTRFPYTTGFASVRFRGAAEFKSAEFVPKKNEAGGQCGLVDFTQALFARNADFSGAEFDVPATFNNAKFRNTTSFRGASFAWPPKFFETEMHEDLNFNRVDWKAEIPIIPSCLDFRPFRVACRGAWVAGI